MNEWGKETKNVYKNLKNIVSSKNRLNKNKKYWETIDTFSQILDTLFSSKSVN